MSTTSAPVTIASVLPAVGLCGALNCPGICSRVQYCPAGLRRTRQNIAMQAARRFLRRATPRQLYICDRIKSSGLCPTLCNACGGCFMPQHRELRSEARRAFFRAEDCLDMLLAEAPGARP